VQNGRDGSQIRHIPHREVIDHRVPDGLDQDHPGQPNAPGREALSQPVLQAQLDGVVSGSAAAYGDAK
jgi:hypothetical protein